MGVVLQLIVGCANTACANQITRVLVHLDTKDPFVISAFPTPVRVLG